MRGMKRVLLVIGLATVPMLGPLPGASAADPSGLTRVDPPGLTRVEPPGLSRPRPAPVPLLGVGLPAFALAGAAVAGYRFWRRRRAKA